MFLQHDKLDKEDFRPGILLERLGHGDAISAVHWNFKDGAVNETHNHTQEQFGYIIKGGFQITIGEETTVLKAGDAYYVPAGVPHRFVALGDTEAIDVFTPIRDVH